MRHEPQTSEEVRRLARELLPRALGVASQITERVIEAVPELAPAGVADSVRLVQESTDQNIGAMLSTLAFGVTATTIEPPAGTQDLLRNLTAAGGNVTHLLRAYRIGHQLLWQLWTDHVYAEVHDPTELPSVMSISSSHLFDFIDRACQRIVDSSPLTSGDAETGPPRRPTLGSQPDTVRALLGSDLVDLDSAGATLGYDLRQHHVALLVAPLIGPADVRRELDLLIAPVLARALAIPSGEGSWWAWLGFPTAPSDDVLAHIAAVSVTTVLVGMGEPAQGRDGFRRTLAQAREAERTGRLALQPSPAVIRHRHIEIAAMLCSDPDKARALAADRLAGLTTRDETGERLRATVRALARTQPRADRQSAQRAPQDRGLSDQPGGGAARTITVRRHIRVGGRAAHRPHLPRTLTTRRGGQGRERRLRRLHCWSP